MKRILVLSILTLPLLLPAQSKPEAPWSDLELATYARAIMLGQPTVNYDTVVLERVSYSGIFVQLFRAPRPLQLLNPWAPQAYAPSEPNLVFDPQTKRPTGLTFLAIRF